jgi:hypothetical protein
MGNGLGWRAIVLAIPMVAGCEATAVQSSGGYRPLTATEMDQITLGSVGAINEAEAHAFGSTSQAFASTSSLVSSGSSPIAGASFLNSVGSNHVNSQVNAAAGNSRSVEASGSSSVHVDSVNGGASIDATGTGAGGGDGTSHAQVSMQFYGISTNRVDLVFGSATAVACCTPLAEAQVKIASGAGGQYSRELRGASVSNTQGQVQSRVDIAVASSSLPIIDTGQMSGLLTPRGSPMY